MSNDTITLIANIALTLTFLAGLIFGIAQTRSAALDRRERLTIQTLREFQTREFVSLMQFMNTVNMPATQKELYARSAGEQTNFIQFAQEMESLGILVAEKLINIELVDKTLGAYVVTCWQKYKPMFLDIREQMPDPFLGEYFQWLAENIDERMQKNPRKPFFETGRKLSV